VALCANRTFGADQRQRAAIRFRSAALATGEATPLRGYSGELTYFTGATRPTRSAATGTCAWKRSAQTSLIPAGFVDALERG